MEGFLRFIVHPVTLVAFGGAVGSMARYGLGRWLMQYAWAKAFPWATFTANITGAFILGLVMVLLIERSDPPRREWQLLLGTGFCGGFTTFSTLQWEVIERIREGRVGLAFLYLSSTLVAGFVAVWLAVWLSDR